MQRKKLLELAKHLQTVEQWPTLTGPRPGRGYRLLDDWWTWDRAPRKFTMAYFFVRYYTKDGTKRGTAGGIAAHGFGLQGLGFGFQEYHIDDIIQQFSEVFGLSPELSQIVCLPPQRYNDKKDRNDWDYLTKITAKEAAKAILAIRGGQTRIRDIWGDVFDRLMVTPPRRNMPQPRNISDTHGKLLHRMLPKEKVQEISLYEMPHNGRRGGMGRKIVEEGIKKIYATDHGICVVTPTVPKG